MFKKDHKLKSKESFDMQSAIYDQSNYSRNRRKWYPIVLSELRKLDFVNILDLGCGTGVVLSELLESREDIKAVGLDLSGEMLKVAGRKIGNKASLIQGDAEDLPFEDGRFDIVMIVESFHHYPNPMQALSEIKRVLKPSGKIFLCDTWIHSFIRPLMNIIIKFGNEGDVRIYSENEITSMLFEVGFKNISWKLITKRAYLTVGIK